MAVSQARGTSVRLVDHRALAGDGAHLVNQGAARLRLADADSRRVFSPVGMARDARGPAIPHDGRQRLAGGSRIAAGDSARCRRLFDAVRAVGRHARLRGGIGDGLPRERSPVLRSGQSSRADLSLRLRDFHVDGALVALLACGAGARALRRPTSEARHGCSRWRISGERSSSTRCRHRGAAIICCRSCRRAPC